MEEEAKIVRSIFQWYVDGINFSRIAEKLTAMPRAQARQAFPVPVAPMRMTVWVSVMYAQVAGRAKQMFSIGFYWNLLDSFSKDAFVLCQNHELDEHSNFQVKNKMNSAYYEERVKYI